MNEEEIYILQRALQREKEARKQAEEILEKKSLELYDTNESLSKVINQQEIQLKGLFLSILDSYILMDLNMKSLQNLNDLKTGFQQFIGTLNLEPYDIKQNRIEKLQSQAIGESFYSQLLMTLKFWMDDESASFEKTDLYIEKSVQASFQVLNTLNLDRVLDFGKFLFKERFGA